MEVVTLEELTTWLRLDDDADEDVLTILVSSAIQFVEHETNRKLRPYEDDDGATITPEVPEGLKHAIAVFVHAHFDNRTGNAEACYNTVRAICHPYRMMDL